MRWDASLVVCALGALAPVALGSSVHALIVSEGRHAVFTGTQDGTELEFIGANAAPGEASSAPQPGEYRFEIADERFIYIVTWGHPATTRGLLVELTFNGLQVVSGDPAWEAYPSALNLPADGGPPGVSALSREIRLANRRHAWKKAAVVGANGAGHGGLIGQISAIAAWMWVPVEDLLLTPVKVSADALSRVVGAPMADAPGAAPREPGATHDTAVAPDCAVFRISPTKLWPEIELWNGRNAGRGPTAESNLFGNGQSRRLGGGGGGSGAAGSGIPASGRGEAPIIRDPFPNFDPPNSNSIPPMIVKEKPSNPIVPSEKKPEEPPPSDSGKTPPPGDKKEPPPPPPPPQPPPPPVPEPSSALLLLAGVGWLTRRDR